MSKEIDRLKRELNRLGRGRAGSDAPLDIPVPNGNDLLPNPTPGIRPAYGSSRSYNVPSARAYGVDGFGSTGPEGKENIPDVHSNGVEYSKLSGVSVPTSTSRPMSHGSSGRATPASGEGDLSASGSLQRNSSSGGGEGVESWRRAAEVTQNLKARIEMMKVCCISSFAAALKLLPMLTPSTGETEHRSRAMTSHLEWFRCIIDGVRYILSWACALFAVMKLDTTDAVLCVLSKFEIVQLYLANCCHASMITL